MTLIGVAGFFINNQLKASSFVEKSEAFNYDIKNSQYISCKAAGILPNIEFDACYLNPNKIAPNAAIIGDSHAEDKFPGIEQSDLKHNWIVMANTTCPPVLGINVLGGNISDCNTRMAKVIDWVIENPEIKLVALSFFGNAFLDSSFAADHLHGVGPERISFTSNGSSTKSKEQLFFEGLNSVIYALEKANKRVVVMVDTPELPFFPRDCFRKRITCNQNELEILARQNAQRELLKRLVLLHPKLEIYDPIGLFCKDGQCTYQNEKFILYKDSHHLSYFGSLEYGKDFVSWLESGKGRVSIKTQANP
jgi:hypothetical protein